MLSVSVVKVTNILGVQKRNSKKYVRCYSWQSNMNESCRKYEKKVYSVLLANSYRQFWVNGKYLVFTGLEKYSHQSMTYCITSYYKSFLANRDSPEATVITVWKTPICKRGVCKRSILKHPVFNILNFRGWIKCIFDTVD